MRFQQLPGASPGFVRRSKSSRVVMEGCSVSRSLLPEEPQTSLLPNRVASANSNLLAPRIKQARQLGNRKRGDRKSLRNNADGAVNWPLQNEMGSPKSDHHRNEGC
jgi:hypothetical protein